MDDFRCKLNVVFDTFEVATCKKISLVEGNLKLVMKLMIKVVQIDETWFVATIRVTIAKEVVNKETL
jgi:hypothetical protein